MRSSHRGSGAYYDAVLVEKTNQGAGRGQEGGARAMAQARHGERAAAAPENLSNEQITSTQPRRLSLEHAERARASEGNGRVQIPVAAGRWRTRPTETEK
jgi:hypothetical protein